MIKAIAAGRVFDGAALLVDQAVLVQDGRIAAVQPIAKVPRGLPVQRLPDGQMLVPGYVDLQVNGGGGVLFLDQPDAAGVAAIAAAHRVLGTTTILPTLISGTAAEIDAALAIAPTEAAPGVHIEGPFLNPNRRGIHPLGRIRTLEAADLASFRAVCRGVRLLTLAPEMVPLETIAALTEAGVVVFAGHSEADWAQMQDAARQGLRGVTHLFNAMSQVAPRAPGVVGAALTIPELFAGLILDGLHVHAANARIAHSCLGAGRLFLVSDAMSTVGSDVGSLRIGDTEVTLQNGRLSGPDGTLGGAHLCLAEAVRHAVQNVGLPLTDALRMATATPAAAVGLADRGRLRPGARADLLALDGDLAVRHVWFGGDLL